MKRLLGVSFVIAGWACFGPRILSRADPFAYGRMVLLFTICWFVLLSVALFRFGRRGLWLLIGLPFVLYWPLFVWMFAKACAENPKGCLF